MSINPIKSDAVAQIEIPSKDISADMDYLINLGFRLLNIFPDDSPEVAVMEGHGMQLRLDKTSNNSAPTIHILTDSPDDCGGLNTEHKAPNGTIFKISKKTYEVVTPKTQHQFEVRQLRDKEPWVIGRAGMLYRDLIPGRLGGGIMASHIRIPTGGPVPDMVHFHAIGFQLIYCYRGWVKLVYEDQGEPFILKAGDCVNQPPEIRHRVLEASDNLEVIEIGVPAEHMTSIDHDLELPTKEYRPEREFQGQRFCPHKLDNAEWKPFRIKGFESRDSGIHEATNGVASVEVARIVDSKLIESTNHNADILFTFVLEGTLKLSTDGYETKSLGKGDAFVVPPKMNYSFSDCSSELELLEVTLPTSH